MRQLSLLIFVLCIIVSCEKEKHSASPLSIDLSSELVTPNHYIVTKNNKQINVDGVADETSWGRAEFSDLFIDIEGEKKPKFDTRIKMLWDEKYLYVYAEMEEPHIWGDIEKRDAVIFHNNDFEVFIAPSGTTRNYAEIEINALGTIWDLVLDKPYRDGGKANNHWNLSELKSAIHIEGSLNDHTDVDSFWTIEMAIPMNALIELKNKPRKIPKEGEEWRINFSRVEWDHEIVNGTYQRKKKENGKLEREYNWVWSNQNVINMHEPEKWGALQFTNKFSSGNITFVQDENRLIEQVAFALFRQTKGGSLKTLLKNELGNTQIFSVKYSDKDSLVATFYKTNFGFEYKINIPESKEAFLINQAGVLKRIK